MKFSVLRITLLIILIFIVINNIIFVPGNILCWDVFGYYLYLPLKFIYHDIGINDESIIHSIIENYNSTETFYQAMKMPDGGYVLKYTMGLSVFYAPFYFIGDLIAQITDFPRDGFSLPYQYSVFAGGIIYTIVGIWFLSKVLSRFFNQITSSLVLIFIVFATNFIIHLTMYGQSANSHNYLFFSYSLILWLTIKWHENYKLRHILLLGLICGLTILSRPSEVVCLIIPALWGISSKRTLQEKINLLFKYRIQILLFAFVVFIIGFFQLLYWKIHTGHFLFNSYGGNAGEGLDLNRPYILNVLFSFRKGWLIYTPVMVFALIGLISVYRKKPAVFFALFLYFLANLYIISCWSCWWYAQSFGHRAFIPSYPVMAIGLGFFLAWLNKTRSVVKVSGYIILSLLLLLNIFQSVQYHQGIIDGDRMTKEYYFASFGKMKVRDEDRKLLLISRAFDGSESFNNQEEYTEKLLMKMDFENGSSIDSTFSYSGKYAFKLDSTILYSPAIEIPYHDITDKDHAWIKVQLYVFIEQDLKDKPFNMVIHFNHNDYPYKYAAFSSSTMNLEVNKWNKVELYYLTPEVRTKNDPVKIYLWNLNGQTMYVDDFEAFAYEMAK